MADSHLGFRQYNLDARLKDFNRAFKSVLDFSLKQEVDFILIAGDIFNKSQINPETLTAIYKMITGFNNRCQKDINRIIPIIAIEGNHDRRGYSLLRSWLQFLADLDLIILLAGQYSEEDKTINFFKNSKKKLKRGVYRLKDKGVNIYGIPYHGTSTYQYFAPILKSISSNKDDYNILMMHFGIQGEVKGKLGLEMNEQMEALHQKVDYLAIGHFHKMYALPKKDPWIYNPGSTETTDIYAFTRDYPRGIFLVDIWGKSQKECQVQHIPFRGDISIEAEAVSGQDNSDTLAFSEDIEDQSIETSFVLPNRNFQSIKLPLSKDQKSFDESLSHALEIVRTILPPRLSKIDPDSTNSFSEPDIVDDLSIPLLYLFLNGTISYSKLQINTKKLKKAILDEFFLLDVKIITKVDSTIDGLSVSGDLRKGIKEIEQEVFSKLIENNNYPSLVQNKFIGFLQDLKQNLVDSEMNAVELKDNIKKFWKNKIKPLNLNSEANVSANGVRRETK
jgi:DNA repair protein SbcD/Mre11